MEVINIPNFATPVQSISNPSTEAINKRAMQKIYRHSFLSRSSLLTPSPKAVKIPMPEFPGKMDIDPKLNTNFKNSPFQEGVISETYKRPDKCFFKNLKN